MLKIFSKRDHKKTFRKKKKGEDAMSLNGGKGRKVSSFLSSHSKRVTKKEIVTREKKLADFMSERCGFTKEEANEWIKKTNQLLAL